MKRITKELRLLRRRILYYIKDIDYYEYTNYYEVKEKIDKAFRSVRK